jgi:cysteine desulfurase
VTKPATANIYLDYAAATPLAPQVRSAMLPYLDEHFANPSSLYGAARITRQAVEAARHTMSNLLGAKATEIVFTSGGTEGNNLAIQGVLRAHPGASWVTSTIEHDAVLQIASVLEADGHAATIVPVASSGIADPAQLAGAVTDETVLVSLMLANNEIGTIQPVAELAKLIKTIRADRLHRGLNLPLYLHTDAVQAAGYLDLHTTRLGVDLLTISGSKIYGAKGTGALFVRQGTVIAPLQYGGGQERGRRSGTENVAGVVGLATALELTSSLRAAESKRLRTLRDDLTQALIAAIPGASLNGDPKHRLPNNLNLTIPGAEGEAMVLYLDNHGIMASTGSACSTGSLDPSHVLLAIGRTTSEANSSLRLTLGRGTTTEHTKQVQRVLPQIITRLRELGS